MSKETGPDLYGSREYGLIVELDFASLHSIASVQVPDITATRKKYLGAVNLTASSSCVLISGDVLPTEIEATSNVEVGVLTTEKQVEKLHIQLNGSVSPISASIEGATFKFPIVYDKYETSFNTFGEAIVSDAKDIVISQALNGKNTLSFTIPRNSDKWEYLQSENFIKIQDEVYIIKDTEESRDDKGILMGIVKCEHIYMELLDASFIPHSVYNKPIEKLDEYGNVIGIIETGPTKLSIIIEDILAGTRFKANIVKEVDIYDKVEFKKLNPIECLEHLKGISEFEILCSGMPDSEGYFVLTVSPKIGIDRGVQFRYRKNLRSISKRVDSRNVITHLHVFGKNDIGISSVNGNKPFIISEQATNYPRPKYGYVIFNNIDSPALLKTFGTQYLDRVDKPAISYEANIVNLEDVSDFGSIEHFDIGDTVYCYDEDLGIDIQTRVWEIERHPFEPHNFRVVLNSQQPSAEDLLSFVHKAFGKDGKLNTELLKVDEFQLDIDELQFGDMSLDETGLKLGDLTLSEAGLVLGALKISELGLELGDVKLDVNGMQIGDEFLLNTEGIQLGEMNIGKGGFSFGESVEFDGQTFHFYEDDKSEVLTVGRLPDGKIGIEGENVRAGFSFEEFRNEYGQLVYRLSHPSGSYVELGRDITFYAIGNINFNYKED